MSAGLGALLGLGLGVVQAREKQKSAHRDRILQAQTALHSPYTGLRAQQVQDAPSTFSGATSGTLGGFQFGQGIEKQNAFTNLLKRRAQQQQQQPISDEPLGQLQRPSFLGN